MSTHFPLSDLVFSQTAIRHGIPNEPDAEQRSNLFVLADSILEPARAVLGPIRVTSGFRSPAVNALVGGSPQSQHMRGEAADIIPQNVSLRDLFLWIVESVDWDQIIWEFSAWVHVSHSRTEHGRRQMLAAFRVPHQGTVYRRVERPEQAFALVRPDGTQGTEMERA